MERTESDRKLHTPTHIQLPALSTSIPQWYALQSMNLHKHIIGLPCCVCVQSLQQCLTQNLARILEWVAIPSSRGSLQPKNLIYVSYISCIGMGILCHQHHLGSPGFLSGSVVKKKKKSACQAGDIQYTVLSFWLLLLNNTHLKFFHVFPCPDRNE